MKPNNNLLIILALLLVFATGCTELPTEELTPQEEFESANLPTLGDFYEMISRPTDGKIVIQSFTGRNSQDVSRSYSLRSNFKVDEKEGGRIALPHVTVGGITPDKAKGRRLSESEDMEIKALYGKKVPIEIRETYPKGKTNSSSFEFYVPKLISMERSSYYISPGEEVLWNADEANKMGIVIEISYTAGTQPFQEVADAYPDPITRGFVVPDIGRVEVTAEMLKDFPDRSYINFDLIRGNIEYLEGKERYIPQELSQQLQLSLKYPSEG